MYPDHPVLDASSWGYNPGDSFPRTVVQGWSPSVPQLISCRMEVITVPASKGWRGNEMNDDSKSLRTVTFTQ